VTGRETPLLIDGRLLSGGAGRFGTINPATEELLGYAADADDADMNRAINAARNAFDHTDWSRDAALRVHCVRQLVAALNNSIEVLRSITVAEVGTPVSLTYRGQLQTPIEGLAFSADTAATYSWREDLGRTRSIGSETSRRRVREPFGVVAAVTPWNFPHQLNFAKLGPALAAGNTVVLKPAPDTPWCAAEVGRIIAEETDFPPGVVNIVTSGDHRIGAQLVGDPRVDLVAFTGSTATGRLVMSAAAPTIKKVFLELGGKSAFIILEDVIQNRADLAAACAAAARTVTTHAGQGCALTTRLVVPRAAYDVAVQMAAAAAAAVVVGDPTDPSTGCGPLISAAQRDRVQSYLDLALAEGGSFACGGGHPGSQRGRPLRTGFYIEPTVIAGLTNRARVAREEIFGPVLVVLAHDGDADAVRIANDSPYGLSATVFGADEQRVGWVVSRLRTGTVNVNGGVWYSPDMPFGGYKQSGIGREMGLAGFEEYLQTKVIATAVG
jgi:aldehyde dehydrogenase (NAD+)